MDELTIKEQILHTNILSTLLTNSEYSKEHIGGVIHQEQFKKIADELLKQIKNN